MITKALSKFFILNFSKTTEKLKKNSICMLTVSTQIHKLSIFYCILTFSEQSESKLQKSLYIYLHLFRMKENILLHNHSIIITKTLTLNKYYLIYSSHLNFSVPKIMSSIAAFPHPGSN